MSNSSSREVFASRIGFILMTAGCAIGLGNVWRFSYVAGQYGGGFFVLLYLVFLAILGFPVMLMELSLGRAGRSTYPGAFRKLQAQGRFLWQIPAYPLFAGNLVLLMFYSVITGWLLIYAAKFACGQFANTTPAACSNTYSVMLGDAQLQIIGMAAGVLLTVLICIGGVRRVIERSIKFMMLGLFLLLIVLVIQALRLPNSGNGIAFFLKPDLGNLVDNGIFNTIHAAMTQAFFTLSLGIGSIAVCGSYMQENTSLAREAIYIIVLDTFVAIASGLVIFPACAAFNIEVSSGPPLVFITLPHVFNSMAGGAFLGTLFFVFLSIAALSTLVAVFENLVAFGMDEWKFSRGKSCLIFGVTVLIFSLPCILGYNIWSWVKPFGGSSNILDLEDFIVSDNLLPLGAFMLTIFCMNRWGWRGNGFNRELAKGNGIKLHGIIIFYIRWILPLIILAIWIIGLIKKFCPHWLA